MTSPTTAALDMLARRNVPTDIQELLVRGDPQRKIPPGALTLAISAAIGACTDLPAHQEPSDIHNDLSSGLFKQVVLASKTESEAMVILESVLLGVLLYYRPDPRHAAEFLDALTAAALERMRP